MARYSGKGLKGHRASGMRGRIKHKSHNSKRAFGRSGKRY